MALPKGHRTCHRYVAKGNSQGTHAVGVNGNGNGRSPWPVRGKGNFLSGVPFPHLRNRLKALVVDDMSACQRYQRGILMSLGVEADIAETAEEAVEIFTEGANYDLVLIDKYLTINCMTGVEVSRTRIPIPLKFLFNVPAEPLIKRVRECAWVDEKATRIIRGMGFRGKMLAVTASTSERDRREFFAAGNDAYLIKPMTHEMIMPFLVQIDDRM